MLWGFVTKNKRYRACLYNSSKKFSLNSKSSDDKLLNDMLKSLASSHLYESFNASHKSIDHINQTMWELVNNQKYRDAVKLFEFVDSIPDLKSSETIAVSIVAFGGIQRTSKARQQALLISDKSKSAEITSLILDAYSRSDRLHETEGLFSAWLSLYFNTIDNGVKENTVVSDSLSKFLYDMGWSNIEENSMKKHVDSIGVDMSLISNQFPDDRAWRAMARLYADRRVPDKCLSILGFLEKHVMESQIIVDIDIFYQFAMRSVCIAGGTGIRSRIKDLLCRWESSHRERYFQNVKEGVLHTDTSLPVWKIPTNSLQNIIRCLSEFDLDHTEIHDISVIVNYLKEIYSQSSEKNKSENISNINDLISTVISQISKRNVNRVYDAISVLEALEATGLVIPSNCYEIVIQRLAAAGAGKEALAFLDGKKMVGSMSMHYVADALRRNGHLKELAELMTRDAL